jgi:copper transport protein
MPETEDSTPGVPSVGTTVPPSTVTAQADGTSLLDSVLEQQGFPGGQIITAIGRAAAITAAVIGIGALAFGALVLRGSQREAETVGYWMRRAGAAVIVSAPVILTGRIIQTGTGGVGSVAFEMMLQTVGGLALFAGTRIVTVADDAGSAVPGGGADTMTMQRFRVGSSPIALAGIAALVLSFALDGHSGTLEPAWLMTLASMVHVAAAAVWIGGVALIGRTLVGRARTGERLDTGSLVIPFSVIAAVAVAAVGLAGAAMMFVIMDGIGTLFTTPWGWAMLSKLGFVAVAGSIGAYNHFVLVPLLETDRDHPYASGRIMHAVRIEIVCLTLAAAITGALVGLSAV